MTLHLGHHLSAQEIARRERWVAIGVALVAIIIIALWLVSLPTRVSGTGSFDSFGLFFEQPNKAQLIGNEILNDNTSNQDALNSFTQLQAQLTAHNATSTATTQPLVISTSTIELLKQKLKK